MEKIKGERTLELLCRIFISLSRGANTSETDRKWKAELSSENCEGCNKKRHYISMHTFIRIINNAAGF